MSSADPDIQRYKSFNCGRVRGPPPDMGEACDGHFLDALIDDLVRIRDGYLLESEFKTQEQRYAFRVKVLSILRSVSRENIRLYEHPELFSSTALQQQFLATYWHHWDGIGKAMDLSGNWKRGNTGDLAQLDWLEEIERRPCSIQNLKPWNQFLNNGAPGSGAGLKIDEGTAILQVVPFGGVRLLRSWALENKETKSEIISASTTATRFKKKKAKPIYQSEQKNDKLLTNTTRFIINPNPFGKNNFVRPYLQKQALEVLSSELEPQIRRHQYAQRPSFPTAVIRRYYKVEEK